MGIEQVFKQISWGVWGAQPSAQSLGLKAQEIVAPPA